MVGPGFFGQKWTETGLLGKEGKARRGRSLQNWRKKRDIALTHQKKRRSTKEFQSRKEGRKKYVLWYWRKVLEIEKMVPEKRGVLALCST